jgi:hypothetical protein
MSVAFHKPGWQISGTRGLDTGSEALRQAAATDRQGLRLLQKG